MVFFPYIKKYFLVQNKHPGRLSFDFCRKVQMEMGVIFVRQTSLCIYHNISEIKINCALAGGPVA